MPRHATPLTPRELQFIAEWLVDKNAKQAAIRAGYSARSAGKTGFDLLQRPRVQAAVRKALKEQQTRTLITADQVLKDIHRISMTAEGRGEYMAALKGLELIGKHYKLFTEKHEHGGIGGGPVQFSITSSEAEH
jgi:phage terminase small subunit